MSVEILRYSDTAFDLAPVVQLFKDYNDYYNDVLGITLDFQGFEEEIASLPGKYAQSYGGELYLATLNEQPVGCVAYYCFNATTVELKRLFVSPKAQGLGLGKRLMETAMRDAEKAGYSTMVLDSLARLAAARKLYDALGFTECPPYNKNPHADVYYMTASLARRCSL